MRILKIALRNYRGVSDRTVEFAPGGVTIVEGPNEIGKSSIAEAIDRIIEDLDSTSRQRIQATKPVDRDVGPEVTIEVETGPYAFRYRKRFLRDKVTELEIYRPRPENHTGREAHERVQAILAETVDMALWKALRMQQGDVVGQAALTDQTSLSAALDRSAGESPAGDEEVTLFGLAHAEYLQYWTETGRRKQEVTEMERAIAEATQSITGLEEAIRAIEADVEASVRLEAEARRLVERAAEQRTKLGEHQARVDALAKLEAGVGTIEARFDSAQLAANEARRVEKARQDAISDIAAARTAQEGLVAAIREDGPQLEGAQERVKSADAAVAEARPGSRGGGRSLPTSARLVSRSCVTWPIWPHCSSAASASRLPSRRCRRPRRTPRSRSTRHCWRPSGISIGPWSWPAPGSRRPARSSAWRRSRISLASSTGSR